MSEHADTINNFEKKKELWYSMSKFWSYVYWFVGILGVTMSTLAAAGRIVGSAGPYFSVIAAICFGILGFANPQKRSNRYRRGYLLLDPAIMKYLDGLIKIEELYNMHAHAEALIHDETSEAKYTPTANTQSTAVTQ